VILNRPSWSVLTARSARVARELSWTVAPGNTPPWGSTTVPGRIITARIRLVWWLESSPRLRSPQCPFQRPTLG